MRSHVTSVFNLHTIIDEEMDYVDHLFCTNIKKLKRKRDELKEAVAQKVIETHKIFGEVQHLNFQIQIASDDAERFDNLLETTKDEHAVNMAKFEDARFAAIDARTTASYVDPDLGFNMPDHSVLSNMDILSHIIKCGFSVQLPSPESRLVLGYREADVSSPNPPLDDQPSSRFGYDNFPSYGHYNPEEDWYNTFDFNAELELSACSDPDDDSFDTFVSSANLTSFHDGGGDDDGFELPDLNVPLPYPNEEDVVVVMAPPEQTLIARTKEQIVTDDTTWVLNVLFASSNAWTRTDLCNLSMTCKHFAGLYDTLTMRFSLMDLFWWDSIIAHMPERSRDPTQDFGCSYIRELVGDTYPLVQHHEKSALCAFLAEVELPQDAHILKSRDDRLAEMFHEPPPPHNPMDSIPCLWNRVKDSWKEKCYLYCMECRCLLADCPRQSEHCPILQNCTETWGECNDDINVRHLIARSSRISRYHQSHDARECLEYSIQNDREQAAQSHEPIHLLDERVQATESKISLVRELHAENLETLSMLNAKKRALLSDHVDLQWPQRFYYESNLDDYCPSEICHNQELIEID